MNDDINISAIIDRIIDNRRIMIAILVTSLLVSVVIALTQTETYKATAYVIPPESKYTQPLEVFLEDGYRLSRDELTPTVVFRTFTLNLQSRKYQRQFFFDNKLYEYFSESNYDKSFEKNFHDQLKFDIESKIVSRDFRDELFFTINFIHTDPEQAALWLNDYIDMVDKLTTKDYVDGINILVASSRKAILSEISSKKNLSNQVTLDRIIQLEEALQIAKDLGIKDRESNLSNQQNVILGDDENLHSKSPMYLYGTQALSAEIRALKERTNSDSFISGLRQLEQKAKSLDSIKVDITDIQTMQIDQKAITPKNRYAPKRKLIVFLGVLLGSFIAFLYLMFTFFITRKKL
tara:strand:+ start:1843 stop:2889 length:1047 start_codon:yes stop_codon:yes gene_type:complete